jgi:diaminopimelate decarboxylase
VALLRRALPSAIELHYAMKANPMPALVQHMAGLVDGLDVASQNEMKVALDAGMDPAEISFAGPGKRPPELAAAIAATSRSIWNLPTNCKLWPGWARNRAERPRVAVRVNPDFELKASGMKMSGGPKPFGVDAEQVPALLRRIGELEVDFQGFHIFTGSQNLRAESIVEAHDRTFELALRLAADAPAPVRLLNIGGGFGIPYFPGDTPLELTSIAANWNVGCLK